MKYLILGVLIFAGVHLLPTFVGLRAGIIRLIGEKLYQALVALASFGSIGLMVVGFKHSEMLDIYHPPKWGHLVTAVLMLISLTLFAASHMPTNIKHYTRHPMLWGLVLWGVAHLFANGDKSSIILFGGLAVYGLLGMASANLRGAKLQPQTLPWRAEVKPVLAGVVAYLVLVLLHPYLFGVSVY